MYCIGLENAEVIACPDAFAEPQPIAFDEPMPIAFAVPKPIAFAVRRRHGARQDLRHLLLSLPTSLGEEYGMIFDIYFSRRGGRRLRRSQAHRLRRSQAPAFAVCRRRGGRQYLRHLLLSLPTSLGEEYGTFYDIYFPRRGVRRQRRALAHRFRRKPSPSPCAGDLEYGKIFDIYFSLHPSTSLGEEYGTIFDFYFSRREVRQDRHLLRP